MRRLTYLGRIVTPIAIAILLSGCGGFFPSKDTIVSLSVTPLGAVIQPQTTQQYTATATFGDNTQRDVTDQVNWTSSSTSVATINSTGLAAGVALGSATITAQSTNDVKGTATLTVSSKTVTSVTISPTTATISISAGQTAQFTATVNFSDGTNLDVTSQATWTSSAPSVAVINSSGLASPVSAGNTSIGASYGGRAASPANLQVTQ